MKTLLSTMLALSALLVGCATATVGTDFNGSAVARLERDKTTVPQASALLGRTSDQTQAGASGALAHTWRYIESKATMGTVNASTKSVTIVFNPDGTFQRVLTLSGIELTPEDRQRLFAAPAVAAR